MAFVFDDDAMDCPKTPEHWSDVGPLQGRMAVLEQQLQSSQAQVAGLGQQVGMLGQQMRQVELELCLALTSCGGHGRASMCTFQPLEDDAAAAERGDQGDALSAAFRCPSFRSLMSRPGARKARPGPRERQRMREARLAGSEGAWFAGQPGHRAQRRG